MRMMFRSGPAAATARRRCRGLGLVELLVGLAVGGIVLAASLAVFAQQLSVSGAGSQSLRMAQDLRASTALIARSVRQAVPPADGGPALVVGDAGRSLRVVVAGVGASEPVAVGYRLSTGTVEMRLGDGRWQALTDPQTVRIMQLSFQLDEPGTGCPSALWMPAVRWDIVATAVRASGRTELWSETAQVRHALPRPGCQP